MLRGNIGWVRIFLLLLCTSGTALANDTIWAGLFRYQQQMAQLGSAEAQYKLAEHYEQGLGVEPDREQARHWYEKALQQGYEPAGQRLKALDRAPAEAHVVDPAVAQLEREHKARLQAQQELERIRAEQLRMEQEMRRQQEEVQRLKVELEREKAAPSAPAAPQPQAVAAPSPAKAPSVQQQRAEAIEKAEAEYRKALARRVAQERLEAEMLRLKSTPIGYDN